MWHVSGEWNFLIIKDGNFINWYTLSVIQRIECGALEHVVVRIELDQLLTWAVGSGVLIEVSIKFTRKDTMCVQLNIVMH
jgi:hypothetical protein